MYDTGFGAWDTSWPLLLWFRQFYFFPLSLKFSIYRARICVLKTWNEVIPCQLFAEKIKCFLMQVQQNSSQNPTSLQPVNQDLSYSTLHVHFQTLNQHVVMSCKNRNPPESGDTLAVPRLSWTFIKPWALLPRTVRHSLYFPGCIAVTYLGQMVYSATPYVYTVVRPQGMEVLCVCVCVCVFVRVCTCKPI